MINVTSNVNSQRGDLGLVASAWLLDQNRFVFPRVYPIVPVGLKTDKYVKVKVAQLAKSPDASRAPGASFKRSDFEFDMDSYDVKFYGLEGKIPREIQQQYESLINIEQTVLLQKSFELVRGMEVELAAQVFNRTTFPIATATGHDPTNEWDDFANADPITDMLTAMFALGGSLNDPTGLSMLVNWKVYWNLCRTAKVQTALGFRSLQDDRTDLVLPTDVVAKALGLAEIIVSNEHYMSGGTDAAPTLGRIFSDEYALVFKKATAGTKDQMMPGLGLTFMWNGGMEGGNLFDVENYPAPDFKSDIVQVSNNRVFKEVNIEAGYLIGNVTT